MRYLSGIQPSGVLHIGNYFGAMRQHVARQEGNECYFFIADYHSLTTVRDPEELRKNVMAATLDYLAIGLDPERCVLFRQSDVPQVVELTWVLSTITSMGLLERCHSYKDKIAKGLEASHGLFSYPVLMAADILLYQSERVPVGRDQVQHLEVTRDIAVRFNHLYGDVLALPEADVETAVAIVPGTDGQKMSKSYGNTIEMFASQKKIRKAVMSIVTDSKTVEEPKDPEGNVICQLYRLVASSDDATVLEDRLRAGGFGYGDAKKELFSKTMEYFEPYRAKRDELAKDEGYLRDVLVRGAERAREVADRTLEAVYRAVGIR